MTAFGKVTKKLAPGQPGTLRLTERYGHSLVCVRYRRDTGGSRRLTSVELIVDVRSLRSAGSADAEVLVPIAYAETELRRRARDAGAEWDPGQRRWRMSRRLARRLGIADRIPPRTARSG